MAAAAASSVAKAALKQLNAWKTFGGTLTKFSHASTSTKTDMKFCVFVPDRASKQKPVPALYWLSGLTCNEDNFVQKAGAFRAAAHHNIALVCPDTSPRDAKVEGEASQGWDFGVGAGFYVNATTAGYSNHYRMYQYVTEELPQLVKANLPVSDKQSIFGHSMGGHGALICYLKNPGLYQSCSAFSPICNPCTVPWGVKAFTGYFGADAETKSKVWPQWDASELIKSYKPPTTESSPPAPILIDQGSSDEFLTKGQLTPERLQTAAAAAGVPVTVNLRDGYDHSYFFISTFVDDHIQHHAKYLYGGGDDSASAAAAKK